MLAAEGFDEAHILQIAASLENASEHPLAGAILAAAKEKGIAPLAVAEFQSVTGKGVTGLLASTRIGIGNANNAQPMTIAVRGECSPASPRTCGSTWPVI